MGENLPGVDEGKLKEILKQTKQKEERKKFEEDGKKIEKGKIPPPPSEAFRKAA